MVRKLLFLAFVAVFLSTVGWAQGDSAAMPTKTAATAETTKAPPFRPTKDQIMQGQKLLKEGKLYAGDATGVYNDDTRAAIRTWQKSNGVAISGNFNRATLEKMGIALTDKQRGVTTTTSAQLPGTAKTTVKSANTSSTKSDDKTAAGAKRPAPFQATADQIKQLQQKLIEGKMFSGEADGKRSDALKASVMSYQKANGLNATGGINADTLNKMGIALTDKQKEQVAAQAAYDAAKPSSTKQD